MLVGTQRDRKTRTATLSPHRVREFGDAMIPDPYTLLSYAFAVAAGAIISWQVAARHYQQREEGIRREARERSFRQAAKLVDVLAANMREWTKTGLPMSTAAAVVQDVANDLRGDA